MPFAVRVPGMLVALGGVGGLSFFSFWVLSGSGSGPWEGRLRYLLHPLWGCRLFSIHIFKIENTQIPKLSAEGKKEGIWVGAATIPERWAPTHLHVISCSTLVSPQSELRKQMHLQDVLKLELLCLSVIYYCITLFCFSILIQHL